MKTVKTIAKAIKRYAHIYMLFIKNCLIKQMEYRFNFLLMLFLESCFLGTKLVYAFVIYNTGIHLNGLPYDSIFMFTGTFLLMTGIFMALFFFNFTNIQQYVSDGSLDLFITKPISLQFITTLRNVDFGTLIPNIIGGIIILSIGWRKAGVKVDFIHIGGYIGYLLCGVVVVYSVMLVPQLLSFLTIKGNALREITDALWDSNGMPMTIYNKPIRTFGTYIFPLFVFSNFSSLFALDKLSKCNMVWGIIAPILFLGIVRLVWVKIIRSYSSASS